MKIFQKVQGNLATNLYATSDNKTASVKKADSEDPFEHEYPLPAWNDLWVDKNGQLWLAVGENVRCMRDSNGKWCDPTAIIPLDSDEVKNAGPFIRVEDDDITDADHEEARPDRDGIWVDSNEIYWQVYGDKAAMFCDPEHTDWTTGDAGFRLDRNPEPVDKILAYGPFTYIKMSETKTASVNAMLTRMNVKTGAERLLKSFKTSSANEALRLAEKQFGKMTEVKITRGLHSADAYDKASRKSAARSFKTARRKLSAEERLRLIDEDRDDEDWDY